MDHHFFDYKYNISGSASFLHEHNLRPIFSFIIAKKASTDIPLEEKGSSPSEGSSVQSSPTEIKENSEEPLPETPTDTIP